MIYSCPVKAFPKIDEWKSYVCIYLIDFFNRKLMYSNISPTFSAVYAELFAKNIEELDLHTTAVITFNDNGSEEEKENNRLHDNRYLLDFSKKFEKLFDVTPDCHEKDTIKRILKESIEKMYELMGLMFLTPASARSNFLGFIPIIINQFADQIHEHPFGDKVVLEYLQDKLELLGSHRTYADMHTDFQNTVIHLSNSPFLTWYCTPEGIKQYLEDVKVVFDAFIFITNPKICSVHIAA